MPQAEYEQWRDEAIRCWPFKTIGDGLDHAYEMGLRHATKITCNNRATINVVCPSGVGEVFCNNGGIINFYVVDPNDERLTAPYHRALEQGA